MESHDSGAESAPEHRGKNGDRKGRHRLTVRATEGTRTGSTALRWIGADRTQQGGAYKRDPAGTGRLGTLCQEKHWETHQQTEEPERTAPVHHRQTRHLGFPLCPKGHDITGGSVNGRGEGNRRREKGGKGPSIEGTRPGKTGQKGSKVLLGSYRDAGRGRRIIFADGDQKNFRISLRIA